jgi:hypothetical protein
MPVVDIGLVKLLSKKVDDYHKQSEYKSFTKKITADYL